MQFYTHEFGVSTHGQALYEFTPDVERWLAGLAVRTGLLTLFCRHTSASLTIQENADPDVIADLNAFLTRLVAEDQPLYEHTCEGPDDMPAHIRAALTQTSLSIPVVGGRMTLGTWQGIYLFEHRRSAHWRGVQAMLLGEA
jgi:secondary thiamine-phosphate synthase enzyme